MNWLTSKVLSVLVVTGAQVDLADNVINESLNSKPSLIIFTDKELDGYIEEVREKKLSWIRYSDSIKNNYDFEVSVSRTLHDAVVKQKVIVRNGRVNRIEVDSKEDGVISSKRFALTMDQFFDVIIDNLRKVREAKISKSMKKCSPGFHISKKSKVIEVITFMCESNNLNKSHQKMLTITNFRRR